ncbi:hypothetical protein DICA3_F16974 [Diutina catenulata]
MDNQSLDIISRFKQRVLLHKTGDLTAHGLSNRGHKLAAAEGPVAEIMEQTTQLHPKVVEYDGRNHFVLTSEVVERSNAGSKRKWMATFSGDAEDDEGDDDDDEADDDSHPYKQLRLADILAPLNHPSEVVSHPAISRTYRSPIFNKLAMELIDLIELEQYNLNWLNKLLSVLNGEDWYYLLEDHLGIPKYDHGLTGGDENGTANGTANGTSEANGVSDASSDSTKEDDKTNETEPVESKDTSAATTPTSGPVIKSENGVDPFFALPEALRRYDAHQVPPHADDESGVLKEELINYLQVSIQRQHEYIKNLTQIRNGLVRSDRLKRDIYKWSKEMYDKKST